MEEKRKSKNGIITTLCLFLALVFIFLLCFIYIPSVRESLRFTAMAALGFLLVVLGIALIFFTYRLEIKKPLKKYLIMAGFSAVGIFIFSILHNIFYGISAITFGSMSYFMKFLDVLSFIISIFILPVLLIVGIIGSLYLLFRKKLV